MKPTLIRWRNILTNVTHYYGEHCIGRLGLVVTTNREGVVTSEITPEHVARMRLFPSVWREETYPDPSWSPVAGESSPVATITAPEPVEPAPGAGATDDAPALPVAPVDASAPIRRGPGRPPKNRG